MTWTVYRADVTCGCGCGVRIPAGEPVALLCDGKFKRSAGCAGDVVDAKQVDAARLALEAEDAARLAEPQRVTYATRRPEDGFQSLRDVSRTAAAPKPFHDLSAKDRRRHNAIAGNK
jgi:hypothetical protein